MEIDTTLRIYWYCWAQSYGTVCGSICAVISLRYGCISAPDIAAKYSPSKCRKGTVNNRIGFASIDLDISQL